MYDRRETRSDQYPFDIRIRLTRIFEAIKPHFPYDADHSKSICPFAKTKHVRRIGGRIWMRVAATEAQGRAVS